jgi:hypothetical protein
VLTDVPSGALFTDTNTVYTHPANHAISVVTGLQTALDAALPKAGGALTGAVTTNSTFDGRNVSVDGTKLDSIESSATADQTKADIEGLGIAASSITGALPAISGAALTNIDAATVSSTAPSSPAQGDMWFDSTSGTTAMKVWSGAAWDQMSNKFSASGGTITTYTLGGASYKVHTFTSSGTFTAETTGAIDVLVVAGGGGGGQYHNVSGAGGAGGVLVGASVVVSPSDYSIVIGSGGGVGSNGANTTGFSVSAYGGGAGGQGDVGSSRDGKVGGSGGGGSYEQARGNANQNSQGSFTGYGNNGAAGGPSGAGHPCGGGGGAGASAVTPPNNTTASNGGIGIQNSYRTGSSIYYAGGGGGGIWTSAGSAYGAGGLGGGGRGGSNSTGAQAAAGSANTGGGGGGGGSTSQAPKAGGSGIVIVRYLT